MKDSRAPAEPEPQLIIYFFFMAAVIHQGKKKSNCLEEGRLLQDLLPEKYYSVALL